MVKLSPPWYSRLCFIASLLALGVVMLGAYTRLTHAGLGCPDWPGCYGQMIVAEGTVESTKAWTEMIHRYIAGTLGLLTLVLCISSYCISALKNVRVHTTVIIAVIVFQALLGMWTVTLKLHPTVVMGHLIGGMTLTSLLWWLYLRTRQNTPAALSLTIKWKLAFALGLILVAMQIMLGGWTSSNYAALACVDFPTCHGVWWPDMRWSEAFSLLPPIDHNYEGGWLEHPARITIHMMHRIGALIVACYVFTLTILTSQRVPELARLAHAIQVILIVQLALGISNVVFFLPLGIAVLHNGMAAVLLLSMVTLNDRGWSARER